jgi:hypothetical protein
MTIQWKGTDIFANVQLKLIDTEADFVDSSGRFYRDTLLILPFNSETAEAAESCASSVQITKFLIQYCRYLTCMKLDYCEKKTSLM